VHADFRGLRAPLWWFTILHKMAHPQLGCAPKNNEREMSVYNKNRLDERFQRGVLGQHRHYCTEPMDEDAFLDRMGPNMFLSRYLYMTPTDNAKLVDLSGSSNARVVDFGKRFRRSSNTYKMLTDHWDEWPIDSCYDSSIADWARTDSDSVVQDSNWTPGENMERRYYDLYVESMKDSLEVQVPIDEDTWWNLKRGLKVDRAKKEQSQCPVLIANKYPKLPNLADSKVVAQLEDDPRQMVRIKETFLEDANDLLNKANNVEACRLSINVALKRANEGDLDGPNYTAADKQHNFQQLIQNLGKVSMDLYGREVLSKKGRNGLVILFGDSQTYLKESARKHHRGVFAGSCLSECEEEGYGIASSSSSEDEEDEDSTSAPKTSKKKSGTESSSSSDDEELDNLTTPKAGKKDSSDSDSDSDSDSSSSPDSRKKPKASDKKPKASEQKTKASKKNPMASTKKKPKASKKKSESD
jgi:hypothetical protein